MVPHQSRDFSNVFSIVFLHFFIIAPRFFHCFSIVLLDIIFPSIPVSPVFFHSFSSNFTQSSHSLRYQFILPFHQFSSVLPWCYSISPSLPFYYLSVSNAYPYAPPTIPTVAPYKRFCSFLPWFISALLLHSGHTSKPHFFHCFSIVSRVLCAIMVPHRSLNFSIVFPPHQFPSFYFYFTWNHFPSVLLKFSILFPWPGVHLDPPKAPHLDPLHFRGREGGERGREGARESEQILTWTGGERGREGVEGGERGARGGRKVRRLLDRGARGGERGWKGARRGREAQLDSLVSNQPAPLEPLHSLASNQPAPLEQLHSLLWGREGARGGVQTRGFGGVQTRRRPFPIVLYAINLSFHFINFSSVLPWCYSISPSLPLYYPSVSNAYPYAPSTIPTVAPYKRFCSFLPWFSFRASTP